MAYNRLASVGRMANPDRSPLYQHFRPEVRGMPELNNDEIQALAKAVGLDIQDPELTEVGYSLNAILEAMDQIDVDGLNAVEPLPIILQSREAGS